MFSCKNDPMNNNPLLTASANRFGAPAFDRIRTEHYLPAFREAIAEGKREIAAIAANPDAPTFENTVRALEYAGGTLSSISALFFNLNEAITDGQMQSVAREITPELTAYSQSILMNDSLFSRIRQVYEQRDSLHLDEEDARLLEKTYRSFADNGAALSPEKKAELGKIREELSLASLMFADHVLAATNGYILHLTDSADLEGLPRFVAEAGAMEARQRNLEGWVYTLQQPSYGPFLQYSSRRDLREKMWRAYNTRAAGGENDNLELIRKITGLRLREARLLGYGTYADYALKDNMAKNAATVNAFEADLLKKSLPYGRADVAAVAEYARRQGLEGEFMPWDMSYYSEKLKDEKYDLNDELLKPYFRLENVQEAVFALADSLYGLKFVEAPDIPGYHPDVKVYDVQETDGRHIAVLYMDFFPRESKQGGAWMTAFRDQRFTPDGKEERPLVSLVMNFSKPTETDPSLLTFYEVTTLLHEFGHALHGMMAEGRYGSLTGTNVTRDFVELPSQIMENWAAEPEFLASFARHYRTGETIPRELIDKIIAARNYNSGYQSVRQLAFGIDDMAWHTLESEFQGDVTAFEKEATRESRVLPDIAEAAFSPSFSHIFSGGYAAGYYSYKWAEVLEADAFQLFKEKGIFNREVAGSFRRNILSRGDIEDADVLYRKFRGRDPQPEALMEKLGLTGK